MFTTLKPSVLYVKNSFQDEIDNVVLMEKNNFSVYKTDCYEMACEMFSHHRIDLILLEFETQNESGLKFIEHLRNKNIMTPAVIITNNIHHTPLLEILNLEVTSCILNPYSSEDLLYVLHNALSKVEICHPLSYTDLNMGFSYDPLNKNIISSNGEIIKLCNKESKLIELLLQNKEHITSYEIIETIVWQNDFMSLDSLRTLIRGIRKKTYPNIITNHNSIGYKIDL